MGVGHYANTQKFQILGLDKQPFYKNPKIVHFFFFFFTPPSETHSLVTMPNGKDQIVLEILNVKKWNQNVSLLLVAAKASLKPITNASESTETSGTSKLKKLEPKLERDGIAQLYFLSTWHNLTHKDEDAAHDIIYKEYNKWINIYYMFILRGTKSKSYRIG